MELIEGQSKTSRLIDMCILNNYTYVGANNRECKKAHYIAIQKGFSNLKTKTINNLHLINGPYVVDNIGLVLTGCVAISID